MFKFICILLSPSGKNICFWNVQSIKKKEKLKHEKFSFYIVIYILDKGS